MKLPLPQTYPLIAIALTLLLLPALAHAERREILWIGDSIGASVGVARNRDGLTERLERRHRDWFIANVSRPGMPVAPGGSWPPFDLRLLGVGGVSRANAVVTLGVNDYLQSIPLTTFRTAYGALVNTAAYWNIRLVCVTPIWHGGEDLPNQVGAVLDDYRAIIADVCAAAVVIDGRPLVPHDPAYYVDEPSLHPNARGYNAYAHELAPLLATALEAP